MSTEIGIGFSDNLTLDKAAEEAAHRAKNNIKSSKIDFCLVFTTIHYDPTKTTAAIYKIINQSRLVGCSSAGIILSDFVANRGILVVAIASSDIQFGVGSVANILPHNMQKSGNQWAHNCLTDFGKASRSVSLFFIDGSIRNSSPFLKGTQEVLGNVFPIIGAGSSDDFHFKKSYQFHNNMGLSNSATGVVIGGHVSVGVGGRHGWKPLGRPRVINKSEGNIIKIIDGREASCLYEDYFGDQAKFQSTTYLDQTSILYPLGIYMQGTHEYLLRNVMEILPDGSIACQGEIPEGHEVNIMIGNKDSCKHAAYEAAEEATKSLLGKKPKLVIVIDSMARLKLFGRFAHQEIEKIKDIFGAAVPIVGMYSNGEISPFQSVENIRMPHLQNESIVVLAIA